MKNCVNCKYSETKYFPQRYVVAIMCMLGVIVACGQRECLQLTVTQITSRNETIGTECPMLNLTTKEKNSGIISWSETVQTYLKGSFYIGYFVGNVPTGVLCDLHGARYVFLSGIALTTLVTVITPIIITSTPFIVTIILRGIVGCAQSVIYPSISALIAKWIPLHERCFLVSFVCGANCLGLMFNHLTTTVIQASANWPTVFYMWALLGGVWCIVFTFYIYSEPATHPFITDREAGKLLDEIPQGSMMKIPWKAILTSIPLWGLIIVELGNDFTLFAFVETMPQYLQNVLHYQIGRASFFSSIPFTTQWVGALISGRLTDYLCARWGVRIASIRRITTTIGVTLPSLLFVLAGYMGCDGTAAIIMFNIGMLFKGAIYSGFKVNHYDLTVNFTGLLVALISGIGALSGWLSPVLITAMAPNNKLAEWLSVFWTAFGVAVSGNVFYLLLCTDQRQKWDI